MSDEGQRTERLPVGTVLRIERLVDGDPVVEGQILHFIAAPPYRAKSLLYLQPHVAAAILKRPGNFILAARQYCQPELF